MVSILTDKERESLRGLQWFEDHVPDVDIEHFDFTKIEGIFTPDNRMDWDKDWPGVRVTLIASEEDGVCIVDDFVLSTAPTSETGEGIVEASFEEIPDEFQATVNYWRGRLIDNIKDILPAFQWTDAPAWGDMALNGTRMTPV